MGNNIERIDGYAFAGTKLISVALPDSVRTIGERSFFCTYKYAPNYPWDIDYRDDYKDGGVTVSPEQFGVTYSECSYCGGIYSMEISYRGKIYNMQLNTTYAICEIPQELYDAVNNY